MLNVYLYHYKTTPDYGDPSQRRIMNSYNNYCDIVLLYK